MFKKLISLFLAFLLVLTVAIPDVYGESNDYTGHWAESVLQQSLSNGYISGYPDGTLRPDGKITRAEFVRIVNNIFNYTELSVISLTDINSNDWYYKDVQKAFAGEYIFGVTASQFCPDKNLTREQAAVIISRIKKLENNLSVAENFLDSEKMSSYAKAGIGAAAEAGIIKGYEDNTFRPQNDITRAEALVILSRAAEETEENSKDLTIDKKGTIVENVTVNNIHITDKIDDGEVTLKNVIVTGELLVEGGGEKSIVIENSTVKNLSVNKADGKVRILIKGSAQINSSNLKSGAILEQEGLTGSGFSNVIISGTNYRHTVTVKADVAKISVNTKIKVNVSSAKIGEILISKSAEGSYFELAKGVVVELAEVNSKVSFAGTGKIANAKINASGVTFEQKPEKVTVASGVETTEVNKRSSRGNSVDKKIVSISTYSAITVGYGTSLDNVKDRLPKTVEVTLDDGSIDNLYVEWKSESYDGTVASDYVFTGVLTLKTGIVNADNIKSRVTVAVEEEHLTVDKEIVSAVTPSAITVGYGTSLENVKNRLPKTVEVTLDDGSIDNLDVGWKSEGYDGTVASDYVFTGVLTLKTGIANTYNIKTRVTVIVEEELSTEYIEKDGFVLRVEDNMIIEYKGSSKDLIIPGEIKGISVKSIGSMAFSKKNLTSVTLSEGIEKIDAQMAFAGNDIREVVLPRTLKYLGKGAFAANKNLSEVKLNEGLESIDENAFVNCSIVNIEIPGTVKTIGKRAFSNNSIEMVKLNEGNLEYIGTSSFEKNSIKLLTIPSTVKEIDNGAFQNNIIEELNILSKELTRIGSQTFGNNKLKEVEIPNELETIMFHSLRSNPGVDGRIVLTFRDTVQVEGKTQQDIIKELEEKIILRAYCQSVISKDMESVKIIWEPDLHEVGEVSYTGVFEEFKIQVGGNEDLKNLALRIKVNADIKKPDSEWTEEEFTISEDNIITGLSEKGEEKLLLNKNLVLPEGPKEIGNKAFEGKGLKSVKISKSIRKIGSIAFRSNELKSLEIPGNIEEIDAGAFINAGIEELKLNEGLIRIGNHSFNSNKIRRVELPSSLRILEEKAFFESNVQEVKFNDGLELIGKQSFQNNKISKLELSNTIKGIDAGAFVYNSLREVEFPYGIEVIGPKSFGVNELESITIPETVKLICPNGFRKNPGFEKEEFKVFLNKEIILDKELTGSEMFQFLNDEIKVRYAVFVDTIDKEKYVIDIIDWELIETQGNKLIYRGKFDRVPDDKISCGCGTSCEDVVTNMKKVSLIVEVTKGENGGLLSEELNTEELQPLKLEAAQCEKSKYTEASYKELEYAIKLPERYQVQIDRKIKELKRAIDTLVKVDSGDTGEYDEWINDDFVYNGNILTGFSDSGREKFKNNKYILLPELTEDGQPLIIIGENAFNLNAFTEEGDKIRGIKLPETVVEIGSMAFRNNAIEKLDLTSVKTIGDGAFAHNQSLDEVKLSVGLKKIPDGAFSFSALREVIIPEGVEVIGGSAFNECKKIERVTFPTTLKEIGKRAFTNISAFEISIPSNVEKIEQEAFSGGKISSLKLEEGIKEIGKRAFKRNKISDIIIPKSVTSLSIDAFDAQPSLNISYQILLDKREQLKEISGYEEANLLIKKIDSLNNSDEVQFDKVLELTKEIDSLLEEIKKAKPPIE